ncbi:hypothetical protein NP233_g8175 [Leucocoprinus birnbaumii]|uniref:Uncharacterized protein n=1 Tax=Leucocoprinus birnbaumii TaxID=56174 RepID=A0AAD5YPB1_9AGAR|nr:hypothetical protein NP233_g8175 [Leucocoprinus birnbaumii]
MTLSRGLEKRKGGGGGHAEGGGGESHESSGGGSGGGGSSSSSSGSSSSGGSSNTGSSSTSSSRSPPISFGGSSKSISTTTNGGGPSIQIPAGQPFAGRSQGGASRDQIYGTRQYGSGYPGISGAGVSGRPFPFYFWPVTWGGVSGTNTAHYLHSSDEYGSTTNTTRPGGAEYTASFTTSNATANSTFRLLADNSTIRSLVPAITSLCSSFLSSNTSNISTYPPNGPPLPEQAIQYYRASSVVLSLDGYNNSAVFSNDTNAQDSPLPVNVDTGLINCLNSTIGGHVPLVDPTDVTTSGGTGGPTNQNEALLRSEGDFCLIDYHILDFKEDNYDTISLSLAITRILPIKRQRGGGGGFSGGGGGRGSTGSTGSSSSAGRGSTSNTGGRTGSGSSSSAGRGSTSNTGGSAGGGSSSGSGGARGPPVSVGGSSLSTTSTGRGGGPIVNIPAGHPFSGRSQGGGTRGQVYGTSWYGSGYPGTSGLGVSGRGFPFYFWPVVLGGTVGYYGGSHYLDASGEYGHPDNTTRPGGPEYTAAFISSNTTTNSTFRLLADNGTVTSLLPSLISSCNSSISSPSSPNASQYQNSGPPVAEQIIQYYRASSVALSLDGYNNTAVFSGNESMPPAPLPSNVDTVLLNCLNQTIGNNVPLVDSAQGSAQAPIHLNAASMAGNFGVVWLAWWLVNVLYWI